MRLPSCERQGKARQGKASQSNLTVFFALVSLCIRLKEEMEFEWPLYYPSNNGKTGLIHTGSRAQLFS